MVQETKTQVFSSETVNSVPALAEIFLDHALGKGANNFARSECAYHLWRHACTGGPKTRQEIVKLGCLNKLVETADKGDKRGCFHALGCLHQFVDSEDFKSLILSYTGAKLVRCLGDCLNKRSHPRTQIEASRILFAIANNPETTCRLEPIIPKLVQALHISGPSWIRVFEMCTLVANCLRILAYAEASGDPQYTNASSSTSFSSSNNNKKLRREMIGRGMVSHCVDVLQQCDVEDVQVAVISALYHLLEEPSCIYELRKMDSAISCLAAALSLPSIDAKAYSAGCLLALSENRDHAEEIGRSKGAIKELVQMLSTQQPGGKSKKKKKSKEKDTGPVTGAALCLENAAGLLLQLTVSEQNTKMIVEENSIPVLVGLLKSKAIAVMQYSTCILASIGLNEDHHKALIEVNVPSYLYNTSLEEVTEDAVNPS